MALLFFLKSLTSILPPHPVFIKVGFFYFVFLRESHAHSLEIFHLNLSACKLNFLCLYFFRQLLLLTGRKRIEI